MAFTILTAQTIMDAPEVNDNFTHIADGHYLPRVGNSLTANDATNDLGSVATTWNTAHVQNIDIAGSITGTWMKIAEVDLSVGSTLVEFTGLNGDNDEWYNVIVRREKASSGSTNQTKLSFNEETGTNYTYQYINGIGTIASAGQSGAHSAFNLDGGGATTTAQQLVSETIIHAKVTAHERPGLSHSGGHIDNSANVHNVWLYAGIWQNTTATVTSIQIWASGGTINAGTTIQIFSKR